MAGVGIGSFLIIVGFLLWLLTNNAAAAFLQYPYRQRFHFASTVVYAGMVIYLTNAKRRSPWEVKDDAITDVDNLWLVHIFLGTFIAFSCGFGLLAVFEFDWLLPITCKEIETERDIKWAGPGRAKFLF